MQNSEFLIQRISEAVERLSPLNRLNYLVPVSLGIIAVLFAFPDISATVKSIVAVGILISLIIVVNYLPNKLRESIEVLLKIQDEIFIAQSKVDSIGKEQMRQLMRILHQVELSKERDGMSLRNLQIKALGLIS